MGKFFNETMKNKNFSFRRPLVGNTKVEAPVVPTVEAEVTIPERKLYVKGSDEVLELSDKVQDNG